MRQEWRMVPWLHKMLRGRMKDACKKKERNKKENNNEKKQKCKQPNAEKSQGKWSGWPSFSTPHGVVIISNHNVGVLTVHKMNYLSFPLHWPLRATACLQFVLFTWIHTRHGDGEEGVWTGKNLFLKNRSWITKSPLCFLYWVVPMFSLNFDTFNNLWLRRFVRCFAK